MSDLSARIRKAQEATDELQLKVGKVSGQLERSFNGRILNGSGVYSEPAAQWRALCQARADLDEAIALWSRTAWPSPADYEAQENEP